MVPGQSGGTVQSAAGAGPQTAAWIPLIRYFSSSLLFNRLVLGDEEVAVSSQRMLMSARQNRRILSSAGPSVTCYLPGSSVGPQSHPCLSLSVIVLFWY